MKPAARRRIPFGRASVAAVLAAAAVAGWWYVRTSRPATTADVTLPPLPVFDSPFLNTRPDAAYVGSEACRACHPGAFASHGQSGMGRSMADVDPGKEPADGIFDHPRSGRRYHVFRKDGQLWHRELLLAPGKTDVVLAEYPMRFVIGSGRFSRTYLAEIDGFLVESPLTWYSRQKSWGMSPGYDRPDQNGFERAIGEGCLVCHAGRAEALEGSLHRMKIAEPVIGCERCHGPGGLHVEHWRDHPSSPFQGAADCTIVNPARLPRDLADSVCQQCHLAGDARIMVRGRTQSDWRPGLPFEDFRVDYQLQIANAPMKVVGHVDQMQRSRCYQESAELTCLTCHNPHHTPRPQERTDYYRAACLLCHEEQACRVDPHHRLKESPANDCVQCHMPSVATEIQHHAFTHHRIGIHTAQRKEAAPAQQRAGVLQPVHDLARLSAFDQQRALGMAYAELAGLQKDAALTRTYDERAGALLRPLVDPRRPDGALDFVLYLLDRERDPDRALPRAEQALADPHLPIHFRCDGLHDVAQARLKQGRPAEAIGLLRQLIRLRRQHRDWLLLAASEEACGNLPGGIAALEAAVRINTRQPQTHHLLAQYYQRKGDPQKAAWHQERAGAP